MGRGLSNVVQEQIVALLQRFRQGVEALGPLLPRILEDPRSYPREAMVLAAIVALLALTLVFVIYAIYDAVQAARTRRRDGLVVKRKDRGVVLPVTFTLLVALLTVVLLSPLVPPVGRACGSCHAVEDATRTWEESRHAAVSCYGCHAAPGVSGALGASLSGVSGLVFTHTRGSQGTTFDAGCLGCHGSIREGVVEGTVLMQHSDVIDAGMNCVTCHPTVGHATPDADEAIPVSTARIDRSTMSVCLTCHDGVKAASACEACHAERPLDVAASSDLSGVTELGVTCDGCHAAETEVRCVECHGLELPHPATFLRQHAGMSADDPGLCARCHEMAVASTADACACHTEVNVHGTYSEWFPVHGPAAQQTGPGGCLCHGPIFCGKCHDTLPFQ
jgi:hypothetical protein